MGSQRKILIILGPTSSGKSSLAVRLAKKFNGEVVSVDSRQVYKMMDIGSGKITKKEMNGIEHHMLSVASPRKRFSVAQYQKLAEKSIQDILKKNKLPILCGGSAFYIKVLSEGISLPKVKPSFNQRKKLEKMTTQDLYNKLKKEDPRRSKEIDKNNRRRLIRAIEILEETGKPIPKINKNPKYNYLKIGIKRKNIEKLIKVRLLKRIKQGMISEVKKLKKYGLSWNKIDSFGLEYRWVSRYLQKKISRNEMIDFIFQDTIKFSKKQMIWFKKEDDVSWIGKFTEAEKLVKEFLN